MYYIPVTPYYRYGPCCQCQQRMMTEQMYTNFYEEAQQQQHYDDEQWRQTLKDSGRKPFVVNINRAAKRNSNFRTAIWTGEHLQVTLMSINVGEDIGLEVHHDTDQFLRIEQGNGFVQMGPAKNRLNFERRVGDDDAIMVPAGTWHNITNTGNKPLKLYSIYAPPEHPFGTVHKTKKQAMEEENH